MATISNVTPEYVGPTRSHHDQREPRDWIDQHGRKFNGQIEKKTGEWCGMPPTPSGWSAPFAEWMPPARFLKCGRNYVIDGTRQGAEEMHIDYDGWKAELRDSNQSWMERFYAIGQNMSGQAFNPDTPTPQILAQVGPKPLPVEPVLAMEQGNRYALGLTKKVDPRLKDFEPVKWSVPVQDFSGDFKEAKVG